MEIPEKKLKINFEPERELREKLEFDPKKILEQKDNAMPVPEMMKNDYGKIAEFSKMRRVRK